MMLKYINISKGRIILSVNFLLAGSIIYLLFRQQVVFLSWISNDVLRTFNYAIPDLEYNLAAYFMIYCLPDALWYAALLIIQFPFIKYGCTNTILTFLSILLPFGLEILQYFGVIKGTYDVFDILTYLITLIIIILCDLKLILSKQD